MAALKDSGDRPVHPENLAARGRDGYSLFGVLRTKPGRADSPPTLSMSCSDKIACWNVVGIQGALASHLLRPVYIDKITIGEVPEAMRDIVREDCERAIYGRLVELDCQFHPQSGETHYSFHDSSRTATVRISVTSTGDRIHLETLCTLPSRAQRQFIV